MIKVLFFASIREQLGTESLTVEFNERWETLDAFTQFLAAERGGQWAEVLTADNIVKAVNQEVADGSKALGDGDEVAFFPPVTGG
jgi:molybdopterin synthase sulfur carrier subunit